MRHFGIDSSIARIGNFAENGEAERGTAPVGKYLPNAWGLYDMHGNVWEWCSDASEPGVEDRVVRGGCFMDDAKKCRASVRGHRHPGLCTDAFFSAGGFRPIITVK